MPSGVHCCIVNCHNSSHNFKGIKKNDGISFHRIPAVRSNEQPAVQDTLRRRRMAWVAAIRRTTITFEHSPEGARVCSRHFHGKPSYLMHETHPDWAPSLHLGHAETKESNQSRHQRQQARNKQKVKQSFHQESSTEHQEDTQEHVAEAVGPAEDTEMLEAGGLEEPKTCCQEIQTDLTSSDITGMNDEINRLLEENRNLKKQLEKKLISPESFQDDDQKVKFYTGLPSFATLMTLFNFLRPNLPKRALSQFQLLMVTFMRLRLNLPLQHIAYIFGLHRTTVSSAFMDTVSVMYTQMSFLVRWPERKMLRTSMPHQFVEAFGNKVAVIIDCFEIFIEKPSNLHARAVTFSTYKHNNTQKYLIGITPKGLISFISKGWGGRASDKMITENSGFLNHLLPGDMVLADRGFDVSDSVGMMCAEVKIPAFTKGKCQMHAKDVEETRKIAHLRIHVERVIGNLGNKYSLLTETVPIHLIVPCEGEGVTFLDKIVRVCCALTNMCPSVV